MPWQRSTQTRTTPPLQHPAPPHLAPPCSPASRAAAPVSPASAPGPPATARRDDYLILAGSAVLLVTSCTLDDESGVVKLRCNLIRASESAFEPDQLRIAVHEHTVEIAVHQIDRFHLPGRCALPASADV